MGATSFDLERFLDAQASCFATALGELRAGRKRTHWIWFVFPQLAGLGVSATSRQYALSGVAEARAYLAHPVLGPRLREAIDAMLVHRDASAASILGELDAIKLRSCLTLFARAAPAEPLFAAALERFFDAGPDPATLRLLSTSADT